MGLGLEVHLVVEAGCAEETLWAQAGLGSARVSGAVPVSLSLCQLFPGVLVQHPVAVFVSSLPQAADGEPDWSGGTGGFGRHEGAGAAVSIWVWAQEGAGGWL